MRHIKGLKTREQRVPLFIKQGNKLFPCFIKTREFPCLTRKNLVQKTREELNISLVFARKTSYKIKQGNSLVQTREFPCFSLILRAKPRTNETREFPCINV